MPFLKDLFKNVKTYTLSHSPFLPYFSLYHILPSNILLFVVLLFNVCPAMQ